MYHIEGNGSDSQSSVWRRKLGVFILKGPIVPSLAHCLYLTLAQRLRNNVAHCLHRQPSWKRFWKDDNCWLNELDSGTEKGMDLMCKLNSQCAKSDKPKPRIFYISVWRELRINCVSLKKSSSGAGTLAALAEDQGLVLRTYTVSQTIGSSCSWGYDLLFLCLWTNVVHKYTHRQTNTHTHKLKLFKR